MAATLATRTGRFLSEDLPGDFERKFNKWSFQCSHTLAENPLFELEQLIELNRRLPASDLYYDAGNPKPSDRWDEMPPRPLSPEEVLKQIEDAKAWLIIKNAQKDPEYAKVLDLCMTEAEDLAGFKFRRDMKHQEMIIFVTSPNRVTQYHIDRECSFLLQVKGTKTLYVFDGNDRDVLPETEIEEFWAVDNNSAKYREQYQDRAFAYELTPGVAAHIPVNFPHWLKNGNNVSISVNINIQYAEHLRGDIYRANYYLRRMGLKPKPPQSGGLADRSKALMAGSARTLRNLMKGK